MITIGNARPEPTTMDMYVTDGHRANLWKLTCDVCRRGTRGTRSPPGVMSLWGRRVLGQPDSFRAVLGHEVRHGAAAAAPDYSTHSASEDGLVYDCVSVEWTEDEREPVLLERLTGTSWHRAQG